jgi:hypothetical protein
MKYTNTLNYKVETTFNFGYSAFSSNLLYHSYYVHVNIIINLSTDLVLSLPIDRGLLDSLILQY